MKRNKVRAYRRLQQAVETYKDDTEVVGLKCSPKDGGETLLVYRVVEREGKFEIRLDQEANINGCAFRVKNCLRHPFHTKREAQASIIQSKEGFSNEMEVLLSDHVL